MSDCCEFVYNVALMADRFVAENFTTVKPEQLGLDNRSGWNLKISNDRTCIVATHNADKTLQYYGGFEYVDKSFRKEVGDYVFYFVDDSRVQECFDYYENHEAVVDES